MVGNLLFRAFSPFVKDIALIFATICCKITKALVSAEILGVAEVALDLYFQ